MFDSVTPYDEIFSTEFKLKTKIIKKNNCFLEIENTGEKGYRINRFFSTDPNLFLDIKNSPGQKFIE